MCDPKPGARCSSDTWKELVEARAKLARASLELDRAPDDAAAGRRHVQAVRTVERKQAAYDSSPRGQRDLAVAIAAAAGTSSAEVDDLRTRLAVGRQTRIDQKRALAKAQGRSLVDEHLEVSRTLSRLRHPASSVALHPSLNPYDTVGFFVPVGEPWSIDSAQLRATDLLRAARAERGSTEVLAIWGGPDQVRIGTAQKVASAEEARALAGAAGFFFDAQTGTAVEGGR